MLIRRQFTLGRDLIIKSIDRLQLFLVENLRILLDQSED